MAADVINLAHAAVVDNEVDCLAVVLNIQLVAHIEAFAVDRQGLIGKCVVNH